MTPSLTPFTDLTLIGLMSGTSMDGIDACAARITLAHSATGSAQLHNLTLLGSNRAPYSATLAASLQRALKDPHVSFQTLCELQRDVGDAMGQVAKQLLDRVEQQGHSVDAIASHGQTVFHAPPHNGTDGYTLQLGCPDRIAAITNRPVVAQFRTADMALGGQGAPLVPFVDKLLLQHPTDWVAAHNLGGISNLSLLPPQNTPNAHVIGFDTGPANSLLDIAAEALLGQPYDINGTVAASGSADPSLLSAMRSHPYFRQVPPKSTGREVFGHSFLADYQTRLETLKPADVLRTLLELTVESIRDSYARLLEHPGVGPIQQIVFSGGGTQNAFLMHRLQEALSPLGLSITTALPYGIPSQSKEALAFALLGAWTLMGQANTCPEATGARAEVAGGAIWRIDLLSPSLRAKIGPTRSPAAHVN